MQRTCGKRRRKLSPERERYRGPSHFRHMRRGERKRMREKEVRDALVTAEHGRQGHVTCGRKSRFESLAALRAWRDVCPSSRPEWGYRCPYCGGWHGTTHPGGDCVRL